MPKINVYLPDDLAHAVRAAGVPVSSTCQHALAEAVSAARPDTAAEPAGGGPNPSRLTDRARAAIDTARAGASGEADTADLFGGIVAEGENLALGLLSALDIEPRDQVEEITARMRRGDARATSLDPALERAVGEALRLRQGYVGCEHLLLGLAAGPADDVVASTLAGAGADLRTLRLGVRAAMAGFAHARQTLTYSGLSAPIRVALDDIRSRLGRLETRASA